MADKKPPFMNLPPRRKDDTPKEKGDPYAYVVSDEAPMLECVFCTRGVKGPHPYDDGIDGMLVVACPLGHTRAYIMVRHDRAIQQ